MSSRDVHEKTVIYQLVNKKLAESEKRQLTTEILQNNKVFKKFN